MNGMGKGLSPGMPPIIPGMPPTMPQGMAPTMPQGMAPTMPQGMAQAMPQGMTQAMNQGVPPGHQIPPHGDMSGRNEEESKKEFDFINTFLNTISELQLPISDNVINNICAQSGFSTTDPRLSRLISLSIEYFIVLSIIEIKKITGDRKDLQLVDVKKALEKLNIHVYRPEYIVNPIDQEAANIDDNQMFDLSSNIEDAQMFD